MSKKCIIKIQNNKLKITKLKKYAARWIIAQEQFTELAHRQYSLIRQYINKYQLSITDQERRDTIKIICKSFVFFFSPPHSRSY